MFRSGSRTRFRVGGWESCALLGPLLAKAGQQHAQEDTVPTPTLELSGHLRPRNWTIMSWTSIARHVNYSWGKDDDLCADLHGRRPINYLCHRMQNVCGSTGSLRPSRPLFVKMRWTNSQVVVGSRFCASHMVAQLGQHGDITDSQLTTAFRKRRSWTNSAGQMQNYTLSSHENTMILSRTNSGATRWSSCSVRESDYQLSGRLVCPLRPLAYPAWPARDPRRNRTDSQPTI